MSIPELNLGGGIGSGERNLPPGSIVNLKIASGVRNIKAQAIVRGARPQAMAFEFVEMDLEERSRLRKLLMELGSLPPSCPHQSQPAPWSHRARQKLSPQSTYFPSKAPRSNFATCPLLDPLGT